MATASGSFSSSTTHPDGEREGTMFYLSIFTDERIRELTETAAELRRGRGERTVGRGRLAGLRLAIGTLLVRSGTALVSGARPATTGQRATGLAGR